MADRGIYLCSNNWRHPYSRKTGANRQSINQSGNQ